MNPAQGIASIKSKFTEWADKRAAAQAEKERLQKEKDEATADIIYMRAKDKGKTPEEAEALRQEFLGKTAFRRKEAKNIQRDEDAADADKRRNEREDNARKDATAKAKAAAKAAATKDLNKRRKAYKSSKAKWDEYDNTFNDWQTARNKFVKCNEEYNVEQEKWRSDLKVWFSTLRKAAKDLGDDQILRLQSRSVGSSLMLDEARKLMIDADAQQRTVMDSKTDLQFTLASSSDADIAKAVGFYEAELQKLKVCISKGKEDAIAEYEKDLAEIEKRKREITAKTFEVKAPQENQQQGKKNYSNVKDSELPTRLQEARRSFNDANAKLRANPNDKNAQDQKKGAEGRITGIIAEFVRRNIPVPTPGGRRMTMRRRRV